MTDKTENRYPEAARLLVSAAAGRDTDQALADLTAAGVDLQELRNLLRHTRSPATWKAYAGDLADYMKWAGTERPFPIPAARLVAYLIDRQYTLSPSSLNRRLAALRLLSVLYGHPDPTSDPLVRATLAGIRRRRAKPEDGSPAWVRDQVPALRYDDLVAAVAEIDISTPAGRRDRALLEVGFWAGFRVSELQGLTRSQLADTEYGVVITMTHAKQDQDAGIIKHKSCPSLDRGRMGTDPAGALREWLEDIEAVGGEHVFRRLTRKGEPTPEDKPLSAVAIEKIVKRRLAAAGIPNAAKMTVHSLRAGFVTLARENDMPDISIIAQTHHNSIRTLDIYSRPDTIAQHHPVNELARRMLVKSSG